MPDPLQTYGDLFTPAGIQHRFSASSLKAWQKCPRYYYYTWAAGYRGEDESVHLTFGSHYARALQTYYLRRGEGMDREDAIRSTVRALLEWTWNDCPDCDGGLKTIDHSTPEHPLFESFECPTCGGTGGHPWDPEADDLSKSNLKNRWTLIRSFIWYCETWKEDIPVWHLSDGTPAVEMKFEVDIADDISLVGTIDRVGIVGGELMILDQKTTGSTLSPYWFDSFHLDTQMSLYTFGARVGLGASVNGVLVDGAQIAAGFTRFARQPTYQTESQVGEWLDEAHGWIDAIQTANRAGDISAYPRNFSGCSQYGRCSFFDICRRPVEVRNAFLRQKFSVPQKETV